MTIDSGWAAAIASLVSAIIVALTALAAFLQLRHFRNANDIVVYLRLIDHMDSAAVMKARRQITVVAARFASDPEFRQQLTDPAFLSEDYNDVGMLLRFLEHISVLVTKGGVAEGLVLAEYADTFVDVWEQLLPIIKQRRIAFGPHTGRAFEHLAMRSKQYIDSGAMDRDYASLQRDPRSAE